MSDDIDDIDATVTLDDLDEEAKTLEDEDPYLSDDDFIAVIHRLSRDLRKASETLSEAEARFLVSSYYNIQEQRIRSFAQVTKLRERGSPALVVNWLAMQSNILEGQIRAALDRFSANHKFGKFPRSVVGIGPVITAGLISHIHLDREPTVGHFWSFAGLNPEQKWDRSQKRPWNAQLKVLAFKAGSSFIKVRNKPNDVYGKVYYEKKQEYIARNNNGGMVENAKKALAEKKYSRDTVAKKAYESGRLPPGHIDAMARRYAAKLFMAHMWECCYRIEYRKAPPLPYPIVHLKGHTHYIPPPNWEAFMPEETLEDAG